MQAQVHEASVAFTYAWWLTGDDAAAEAAVREAALRLPATTTATGGGEQGEAGTDARVAALLRVVRVLAAPERTMCPASELALLHDGQCLPLDLAAELAEIPTADVRIELAHGRLEALRQTVTTPFEHPERLGGLAVGNPADIAHSRVCPGCADALELLRRGRQELSALPRITPPAALLAALAGLDGEAVDAAHGAVPVSGRRGDSATPPSAPPSGAAVASFAFDDLEPLDLSISPQGPEAGGPEHGRSHRWAWVAAVVFGLAILLVTALAGGMADDAPSRADSGASAAAGLDAAGRSPAASAASPAQADTATGAADDPGSDDDGDEAAAQPPGSAEDGDSAADAAAGEAADAAARDASADDAVGGSAPFTIVDAGVLPAGAGDVHPSGAVISPTEPLRVAVRYTGAAEGVDLVANADLPMGQASTLRVTLSSRRSSHVFLWVAPAEGWAPGRHQIQLLAAGELAGVVDVTVT